MNNIRQLTNYDLANTPITPYTVVVGGKVFADYPYKIITTEKLKRETFKLGYCCEPRGIGFPILLAFSSDIIELRDYTSFEIGKTGMFEFQPEDFNDTTTETTDTNVDTDDPVTCYKIAVPADIDFTLDYVYSSN